MDNREGYGYDWSTWDAWVKKRFAAEIAALEKPPVYNNFEIFRSPKGRWMAFYNTSYFDVQVIDLATREVVVTDFYSSREPKVYAHHVNFNSYVPVFYRLETLHDYHAQPYGLGEEGVEKIDENRLVYMPFAFNSWTIWAADYEFYVDVLDLRDIDNGVLRQFDRRLSFTIPISAGKIRNYVHMNAEGGRGVLSVGENLLSLHYSVLSEHRRPHLSVRTDPDDVKIEFDDIDYQDFVYSRGVVDGPVDVELQLPWHELQSEWQEP